MNNSVKTGKIKVNVEVEFKHNETTVEEAKNKADAVILPGGFTLSLSETTQATETGTE